MKKCCSKCGKEKALELFKLHVGRKDGRGSWCKVCNNLKSQFWNAKNKAKKSEALKNWRETHRERTNELQMNWWRKNPSKNSARSRLYRTRQLKAVPIWAGLKAMEKIYARANKLGKTVDHIVPLQSPIVCGLHCEFNLRPLSKSRNSAKGNRHWPNMP